MREGIAVVAPEVADSVLMQCGSLKGGSHDGKVLPDERAGAPGTELGRPDPQYAGGGAAPPIC